MPSDRPGTLARLGRALLDATLLLLAVVLLLLVVLAVQVRGIVADGRAMVEARAVVLDQRLDRIGGALERLESARPVPAAELAAELAALRSALQGLAAEAGSASASGADLFRRLVLALLAASAPDP